VDRKIDRTDIESAGYQISDQCEFTKFSDSAELRLRQFRARNITFQTR